MPIQYPVGGSIVNNFSATATTRTALVDFIKNGAVSAGFDVVSGASGDWLLRSALFNGNQMNVRIYDPGSGNTARVSPRRADNTQIGGDFFLLPGVNWRIIAYNMQIFVFVPGILTARGFACVSALYTESSILGSPVSIIGQGNGANDTDASVRVCFRSAFSATSSNAAQPQYCNYDGTFYYSGTSSNSLGDLELLTAKGRGHSTISSEGGLQWKDASYNVLEPLVAWGTGNVTTDVADIGGQLWGGFITTEQRTLDSTLSYNGRTFWTVGVGSIGVASDPHGSLMLAVT